MLGKILLCPALFINLVFGSDLGPNPVMVIFSYLKIFFCLRGKFPSLP